MRLLALSLVLGSSVIGVTAIIWEAKPPSIPVPAEEYGGETYYSLSGCPWGYMMTVGITLATDARTYTCEKQSWQEMIKQWTD